MSTDRFAPTQADRALCFAEGFTATARDGRVGRVVRAVYRAGEDQPVSLVLRLSGLHCRRRRLVPVSFVERVDPRARRVTLGVRRRTVARLAAPRT